MRKESLSLVADYEKVLRWPLADLFLPLRASGVAQQWTMRGLTEPKGSVVFLLFSATRVRAKVDVCVCADAWNFVTSLSMF